METINGKLIVEADHQLGNLTQTIENLAQQLEALESNMRAVSKTERTEYRQQITSIKVSLQQLERYYNRLLSTAILTVIGLVSWSIWLNFTQNPSPAQQPHSKVAIARIHPTTNY
jgi:flagellar biosynthesis chaperone FliJ